MLAMPIYIFQISDHVLPSRGIEPLLILPILTLALLAAMSILDVLRKQALGRLAASVETILGVPILSAMLMSPPMREGGYVRALRSLHEVRRFLSSPTMLHVFDVPMMPFFFGVIFRINPGLGAIVLTAGLLPLGIAVLKHSFHLKAEAVISSLAPNVQFINGMQMRAKGILYPQREQAWNFRISASQIARSLAVVAILGWASHLTLTGTLTGGMMIAASIIAGRALWLLEGMIEGWRSSIQTRVAYAHVRAKLEGSQFPNADEVSTLLPVRLATE
jgi:ATP-binding cassette subfamily C protein